MCYLWRTVTGWREEPAHQVGSRRLEMSTFFLGFGRMNLLEGSSKDTFSMWRFRTGGTFSGRSCLEMMAADTDQENKIILLCSLQSECQI